MRGNGTIGGKVLYVCSEDPPGIMRRGVVVSRHYGKADNLKLLSRPSGVRLWAKTERAAIGFRALK